MKNKPAKYEDIDYPVEKYNPARFQEMVAKLFQAEKGDQTFSGKYAFGEAKGMPLVREQGRDIRLLKDGITVGIVQCKRVKDNLDRSESAKEIIKFVMNYLLDPLLIPDIKNFTYYLVTSSGFSVGAADMLDEFSIRIKKAYDDGEIYEWVGAIQSKYKELKKLGIYEDFEDRLVDSLVKLDVKRWGKVELHNLLLKHKDTVADEFFKHDKVISVEALENFAQRLANWQAQNAEQSHNSGSDDEHEIELLYFYAKLFNREAFRVPYHKEDFARFDDAIERVILAINTGNLTNQRGETFERITGSVQFRETGWMQKMTQISRILSATLESSKKYQLKASDHFARQIDRNRNEIIDVFLEICQDAKLKYPEFVEPHYDVRIKEIE